MMTHIRHLFALPIVVGLAVMGCTDDNPTALDDLIVEAEFEIVDEVETFEEVEIVVHLEEGGSHMHLTEPLMEIQHESGSPARIVAMHEEGEGYGVHVMFFEPGEHHIHVMGIPERHVLMGELAEHEVHVKRRHEVIGPYWVEIGLSPAPVMEGNDGHIHVYVYDLMPDGSRGDPVSGVSMMVEVHDTDGVSTDLTPTEEEEGEYEVEYAFGEAGTYEVHVEIDLGGDEATGEFHVPVLSPDDDADDPADDEGEHGHGHP